MKTKIIFLAILLLGINTRMQAQEDRNHGIIWSSLHGLEYGLKAGINIGGASPLPLPEEIRALTGYNPNLNFSIGRERYQMAGENPTMGHQLGITHRKQRYGSKCPHQELQHGNHRRRR